MSTGAGGDVALVAADTGTFCTELWIIRLGAVLESNFFEDLSAVSSSLPTWCLVLVSSSRMALSFLTRITNPLAFIICGRLSFRD